MLKNQLRNARLAAKRTQQECADYIGVNFSTYSCYETGRREPDALKLAKIAEFLGVTGDYLLEIESPDAIQKSKNKTIFCESSDEIHLINTYRTLNEAGKAAATSAVDGLATSPAFMQERSKSTTA